MVIIEIILVIVGIYFIVRNRKMKQEARNHKQQERAKEVDKQIEHVFVMLREFEDKISVFLRDGRYPKGGEWGGWIEKYSSAIEDLTSWIKLIGGSVIPNLKKANDVLIYEFPEADRSIDINKAERRLSEAEKEFADFKTFAQRIDSFPASKMMNERSYGNINSAYWDQVRGLVRVDAVRYVSNCEQYFTDSQVNKIYAIDIDKLLRCVWFFATEKPYSVSDFQKAKKVFEKIYKQRHVDVIIADMYAENAIGGEDVLVERVKSTLGYNRPDAYALGIIASSFMWMKAYKCEQKILEFMLRNQDNMTAKMQERLRSLNKTGGKAPSGFDVKSSNGKFYFDVSALAWRDDEYVGLFENLAFQDKTLTYALAIHEENKELFIPQGINIPDIRVVVNKLNAVFSEEYGNSVTVRSVNCIALSGSGEEIMEGVLVSSGECKQMGILIHIARIGKKLTIKFYTLLLPTGSDLAMQKQQALSLYKKLSPSVTMWESSLKDTMLMAVEQLLNSSAQGGNASNTNIPGGVENEPVF